MLSAAQVRREYVLDPNVVYLNHGSFGAVPEPVLERQAELRLELERGAVAFLARRLAGKLASVRADIAAYVGVGDPDSVMLVPNTTTALNAVARSLPLRRGDEVVVTDHEYGAMRLLRDEVASRAGARVVTARLPLPARDSTELAEAVWDAVSPRTRVLFFSQITSETALVLPAVELCRRAREAGVVSIVDGAHAPGQLDLDLEAIGADCYAGNAHKWLCAPKGSSFLFARADAQEWLSAARDSRSGLPGECSPTSAATR